MPVELSLCAGSISCAAHIAQLEEDALFATTASLPGQWRAWHADS